MLYPIDFSGLESGAILVQPPRDGYSPAAPTARRRRRRPGDEWLPQGDGSVSGIAAGRLGESRPLHGDLRPIPEGRDRAVNPRAVRAAIERHPDRLAVKAG